VGLRFTDWHRAATRIDAKKNEDRHKTLAGKMQDSYFGCMQKMTLILGTVSTLVLCFPSSTSLLILASGIRQGKQLLEMTAKVM
jgi:hypothetical protein